VFVNWSRVCSTETTHEIRPENARNEERVEPKTPENRKEVTSSGDFSEINNNK